MNPKWFNGKDLTSVRNKTSINNPGELSIVIPTPSALKIWKKLQRNTAQIASTYVNNVILTTVSCELIILINTLRFLLKWAKLNCPSPLKAKIYLDFFQNRIVVQTLSQNFEEVTFFI